MSVDDAPSAPPARPRGRSAVRGPASSSSFATWGAEVAGRLDRDELSREQEELVADAIDAAVDAALPAVIALLDRELTPRLEAFRSTPA